MALFSSLLNCGPACVALFVAPLLLYLLLVLQNRRPSRFPRGPFVLPLFGPIGLPKPEGIALGPNGERPMYQQMMDMARVYGDKFGVVSYGKCIVVLQSPELLREVIIDKGEVALGRIPIGNTNHVNPLKLGLIESEGTMWREQRRFALHTLRNLGFGKRGIEAAMNVELNHLTAEIEELSGAGAKPIDLNFLITYAQANVVAMLVIGERLAQEDFRLINYCVNTCIGTMDLNPLALLLDKLAFLLPFDPLKLRRMREARQHVMGYMRQQIQKHRDTFDRNNIRDYIDAFLLEMQKRGATGEYTNSHSFFDEQLASSFIDLFIGPTAKVVLWALLLVTAQPKIGARVRDEIERVIGTKEASFADRLELPLTDAVLSETLRFSGTVPIAAHRALADVELRDGTVIPAGAYIIGNMFSLQHDPRYWHAPHRFDPEANFPLGRDKERDTKSMYGCFNPFGIGKRVCLGETLSRQGLFIFFVGLMQRFEISAHPDHPLPDVRLGKNGLSRAPMPFKLMFKRR